MSNSTHLDRGTAERLLSGELDGEEARLLAAHLETDCARCEALLADGAGVDPLDGPVDLALLRLAPEAGERGNDLEWARVRRRLGGGRRRGWLLGVAAAAALVLVAGVSVRIALREPAGHDAWDGMKGMASAPVTARLRFSVVLAGSEPSVARGANGLSLPQEASLLFRVEASGPADLALFRIDGGELIWKGRSSGAGAVDVEDGGHLAAYPLHGLRGRQRFALVAAPELGAERLEAARAALSAGATPPSQSPISLDVVEVTVR